MITYLDCKKCGKEIGQINIVYEGFGIEEITGICPECNNS